MSAQRPSRHPQRFTSTLSHSMLIVHMVPFAAGWLFALATHAFA
jgi:hypothetical protein